MTRQRMFMVLCIAALITLAAAALPATSAAGRRAGRFQTAIIHGQGATANTLPWLAFIDDNLPGEVVLCSGTVIAPRLVLTAGHCAVNLATGTPYPSANFVVVTRSLDWTNAAVRQVSAVTQVIPAPGFDPGTLRWDAALLVLASPTSAPALPLATTGDLALLQPGASGIVAGWGQTVAGDAGSTPAQLQWTTTVLQSQTSCTQRISPFDPSTQLCALDAPSDASSTCYGDSGGPLIADGILGQPGGPVEVGIISSGSDCNPARPDVFTRADSISAWADSWIAYEAAQPPAGSGTPSKDVPSAPSSRVSLPRMTSAAARRYAAETLGVAFPADGPRHPVQARCQRTAAARFVCAVTWSRSPNTYRGTVTVFYARHGHRVTWTGRYAIQWTTDRCWATQLRLRSCRMRRASGSY